MNLSSNVSYVIDNLMNVGYEAYVVGGAVRDFVMGVDASDQDITTNATPIQVKEVFDKTIDTGLQHGTVTVVVNGENIEVTTFRIDGEYVDNRKPKEVIFTSNLVEDLKRRDFTINALAYNNKVGIIDEFDGSGDIERKVIKAVGEADKRFKEDALRIYRGVRFSCKLGFDIEKNTMEAMEKQKHLTENLSVERIRDEFIKSIKGKYIGNLKLMNELGLFAYYDEEQQLYLKENINTIIDNLDKYEEKETFMCLCLYYKNYDTNSLEKKLKNFKIDNNTSKNVMLTIKAYNELFQYNIQSLKDYDIKKLINKYDKNIENAIKLLSIVGESYDLNNRVKYNRLFPTTIKELDINGNDLQQIGVNGKNIGKALNLLLDEVMKNPECNEKQKLLNIIYK